MTSLRNAILTGTVIAGLTVAVAMDSAMSRGETTVTRLRVSSGDTKVDTDTTVEAELTMTGGTLEVDEGKRLHVKGDFYLGKDATFVNNGTLVIGEPGKETQLHVEPRIRIWTTEERDGNWKYSCKLDDCHVTQTGGYITVEHSEQYTPSLGDIIIQ